MLLAFLIVKMLGSVVVSPTAQQDPAFVRVEIKMAEDGFMCPFLTPMFLDILDRKGAEWVVCRPQESEVEFCMSLLKAQGQDVYTDWLTQLGYASTQIEFAAFDTLTVIPAPPAP